MNTPSTPRPSWILLPVISLFVLICSAGCSGSQPENSNSTSSQETSETTPFDSLLAAELGADDYGMKTYVMAFLKTGPNQDHDDQTILELQQGHMENIQRLAEEGSLVLAGPFLEGGELRGLYLFNVGSVEEARELAETDPAVQAGLFELEYQTWYGSAAIQQLNEIHSRISKESP
ncbi:MAG: YciI family protein [Balneolaceae bacterium]